MKNSNSPDLKSFLLKTLKTINPRIEKNIAIAHTVDKNSFPALSGVTCYTLELWEESMRLPHWHPNACELGYVVSGEIEIMIWRSPGETAVFTLSAGMCWFIPQSALHSLNNTGKEHAKLFIGFSCDKPQDIDIPVAYNGIPVQVRSAYTNPHAELKKWVGITNSTLVGSFHLEKDFHKVLTASPYGFDLANVPPLFSDASIGRVAWAVKSNWNILEKISVLHACLKPGVARDAIWYPDAGTLYVVCKGKAEFHIIIDKIKPQALTAEVNDYIFVPAGILHTFINSGNENLEVTAFFTKADPLPEISLAVATNFFPKSIIKSAMTEYGTGHKESDPLKDLRAIKVSPFLLKVPPK